MSSITLRVLAVLIPTLLSSCSSAPLAVGTRGDAPAAVGTGRVIEAEACGFQLLLFIPISINNRAERAYRDLERQANGDTITDVQVRERWIYAFVGTNYCTAFRAKAIRKA